ncbi:apolipoprotein N-acyltransferase [Methylomonas sp. LL1]|nr:apolipoprotein N-acyltransferase [Methylomonas sp. LL1]
MVAPLFGVMLTLAFAPYDYGYAALVALVFFYSACLNRPVKRAALIGYLFGLGLFGSGIWWVYISIHDFGGADPVSSGFLTLLLVALWALFPALTAALSAKVFGMAGAWFRVLALALLWVAVEYFRGYWLLNGFPWLQIAYSQLDTPLAGYAAVSGVYGVGFLLSASAAALVEIGRGKLPPWPGLIFPGLIWGCGWILMGVQWTQAVGEPINITLVQGNIQQNLKWLPNQKLNTLTLYQQLTNRHWDSDVIIWPETSIPVFWSEVKDFYLEPLAATAREKGVDLVVSLPVEGSGGEYYNSVMTLGRTQALYHKNHLLPFGEYLPLQPLSGWVLDRLQIPLGNFAAGGDRQPLLQAGGHAFVTTICYEDAFGELVIRQVEKAAYLVNVTNDAWFGDTSQPHQHMQMARMRALETGRYLLRATNTGLTGFVLPNGKIAKQAPLYTTTTVTDSIIPMAGMTPYAQLGDQLLFAGMSLLVLAVLGISRYSSRNQGLRRKILTAARASHLV